jgi:hypothetical protein
VKRLGASLSSSGKSPSCKQTTCYITCYITCNRVYLCCLLDCNSTSWTRTGQRKLLQHLVQFICIIKQRQAFHERSPNHVQVNIVRIEMIRMARVRPIWIDAEILQVSAIYFVQRDSLSRLWQWRRRLSCPSTDCVKERTKSNILIM